MKKSVLLVLLVLGLGCVWTAAGLAGDVGYRFRPESLQFTREPGPPSSAMVATDALIARPVGLATTALGTGLFVATLPISMVSHSTRDAAWALVGRPGCWTFVRPLGGPAPKCGEHNIFRP